VEITPMLNSSPVQVRKGLLISMGFMFGLFVSMIAVLYAEGKGKRS
jgi:uncharacterized protein involved in exopolysaccharide biosynthesis